jgi:hypothetical protein
MNAMMSLSLDFIWDFLKPILSDKLKDQLNKSGESKAREDLMALHKVLLTLETQTESFVGSIGDIVAFDRTHLVMQGSEKILLSRRYAHQLLDTLLDLSRVMNIVAPNLSVYKYDLIKEIESYRNSRAMVISKLEEEIYKIEQGDYSSTVINELYLKSLENLIKIKSSSAGIRHFISEQFQFKDLY